MISFIVSVYGETLALDACLACLRTQEPIAHHEIVVCDNNPDYKGGISWRYPSGALGAKNCYESSNMSVPQCSSGDWLCFPSDDSLYVQDFSKIMIQTAVAKQADLVYCDMVYRCGTEINNWGPYTVLVSEPRIGKIDKTNFIIRRELFKGFPPHPRNWCDGAMIEQAIRDGAKAAKAPGVLCVHQ